MPRAPLTFRQRDITAAIKAAEAAGQTVAEIEVTHDGFTIKLGEQKAGEVTRRDAERNEYLRRLREE